jgi:hypothetical protein
MIKHISIPIVWGTALWVNLVGALINIHVVVNGYGGIINVVFSIISSLIVILSIVVLINIKRNNKIPPKTYEFTRMWGDDYNFTPKDGGMTGKIIAWKNGISNHDYLILKNGNSTTRYEITSIQYESDPPDMFVAEVKFAPRNSNEI